jgi:hypothetical protein
MLLCASLAVNAPAVGVSFKMRKRRETGKGSASRGQRRRAARLLQSLPCFALHGYSREPLRPPHPSPKVDPRAADSSFLYFERDLHGPSEISCSDIAALRDHLPAWVGVVELLKELFRRDTSRPQIARNGTGTFLRSLSMNNLQHRGSEVAGS